MQELGADKVIVKTFSLQDPQTGKPFNRKMVLYLFSDYLNLKESRLPITISRGHSGERGNSDFPGGDNTLRLASHCRSVNNADTLIDANPQSSLITITGTGMAVESNPVIYYMFEYLGSQAEWGDWRSVKEFIRPHIPQSILKYNFPNDDSSFAFAAILRMITQQEQPTATQDQDQDQDQAPGQQEPGQDQAMLTAKKRILLVDDYDRMLETYGRYLEKDYDVVRAASAAEALDLLRGPGGQRFDLVVTDYNMPKANGLSLSLTVQEEFPGLPVIVHSEAKENVLQSITFPDNVVNVMQKAINEPEPFLVIVKRVLRQADPSQDQATLAEGDKDEFTKGGIDFNPDNLDLRTNGDAVEIDLPPLDMKELSDPSFTGFTPVILEIVPVQSLPLLLGELEEKKEIPTT